MGEEHPSLDDTPPGSLDHSVECAASWFPTSTELYARRSLNLVFQTSTGAATALGWKRDGCVSTLFSAARSVTWYRWLYIEDTGKHWWAVSVPTGPAGSGGLGASRLPPKSSMLQEPPWEREGSGRSNRRSPTRRRWAVRQTFPSRSVMVFEQRPSFLGNDVASARLKRRHLRLWYGATRV